MIAPRQSFPTWDRIFLEFANFFPSQTPIAELQDDSRCIGSHPGPGRRVFFARLGVKQDGHCHIGEAMANGADTLVVNKDWQGQYDLPTLRVADTRELWSTAQRRWYGRPDEHLAIHAVTGTNGKTTTVCALQHLLQPSLCGRLSTVDGHGAVGPAPSTTPAVSATCQALATAIAAGRRHFALEISSHAMDQKRLWDLHIATATFTNLGHDHLDYHGGVENYFAAKCRLFDGRNGAVPKICSINRVDRFGRRLWQLLRAKNILAQRFGTDGACDCQLLGWQPDGDGMRLRFRIFGAVGTARVALLGRHNAWNLLAAMAVAAHYFPIDQLLARLESFAPPPGRLERIPLPHNAVAFVDYAHTPDALRATLLGLRRHFPQKKIVLIFGCGGERDRKKRPAMAAVAETFADLSIVTNDNPRGESPAAIASEIASGFRLSTHRSILDREEAIAVGYDLAVCWGGILVVAGKGHESTQEIVGQFFPFHDGSVVAGLAKKSHRF
ncbi:MAG: UDP-N-acetylmuramoyl-L-alanyl-D-glutamate--2,6-diaminopimelate ligase [Puniceicoccales bacterium]|nr:UDP-N-acetylmuramoyl-L-alanyl-D-glutamate--2,6-diaminopimelate ligase [Puniceicoccales bacterium]